LIFWRDNYSNKYFDELEIITTIHELGYSDLNETLKHIKGKGIRYELDIDNHYIITLFMSWEVQKKEEEQEQEQEQVQVQKKEKWTCNIL